MEIKEGRLLTRVRLEGKRFRVLEDALIDTGAAFTVIPPVISDFLELETSKAFPKAVLVTASGLIEAPVKILEKLEAAGIEIEKLPVVVHKIPDPAPIKVLLGMNFIEKIKLVINGKGRKFGLEDPL
ncbi:MAG: retroviral-like aspartic protease family protein [archaeon]|nr:retroviral-like aspartic protease family protein [archaeon]MCP8320239.1 retroviral-like aspartic protease family protein [archaeon]